MKAKSMRALPLALDMTLSAQAQKMPQDGKSSAADHGQLTQGCRPAVLHPCGNESDGPAQHYSPRSGIACKWLARAKCRGF